MKTIMLVQPDEAELALSFEKRIVALPPESGILFASVRVEPSDTGPTYIIFVGGSRQFDGRLMAAVVESVLRPEIENGLRYVIEARRGTLRSA